MNKRAELELSLLAVGVFMGVLGDLLLRALPWGLNFVLWMAALLAALLVLGQARPQAFAGSGRLLILPLILFSALFLWHDSPVLKMLNLLALLVALSLVVLCAQGGRVRVAGMVEYVAGSVIAGLNAAFGLFPLLLGKAEWKKLFGDRGPKRALAVARGLLFFFPLLLLFGGLFMAADAVFKELVQSALRVNLRLLFTHFFVAVFCAWLAGGYLRGVLFGDEWAKVAEPRLPALSLGIIETSVVLGLLDLLFLFFVLVQFRYFFGGAALVQVTTGLTYAEYARRGFFELVAVAALSLPLLLMAHWLLREESPKAQYLFRGLAGAQILLLFVIMISAFQRMRLYQAEYGLSEQRLYPTAFMGWLALVFVWFALTVLRGRREQFWFGAMIAGFVLIGALHVLDPDALIARTNIARAKAGRRFDARYATSLSADAVPELVAGLADLSPQDRCKVAARLVGRWQPPADRDWRAWNRSRTEAWSAVGANEASLRALSCADQKK